MKANELREKYLQFFEKHNHTRISGASLIPENDPTVLFTTAGMHPLVPYLLGSPHPNGTRLVNHQRCIRTGDIEEVGDYSHLTFFEMLGNWSLGDYFKEEALSMSLEFLTSSEWLGIDKNRISVSVFEGDENVPADEESARIWERLGIPRERIFFLGRADNWWGPAGATGPCGPDSEMFIDMSDGTGMGYAPESTPASGDGRYLEIWNDVFMQYNKMPDGSFQALERKCVDTGMGLERTTAILQGKNSAFDTELFTPIIQSVENIVGLTYGGADNENDKAFRIIADHIRTAVFLLGDEKGVCPSNLGQGYILRRIIRRAMRYARQLGQEKVFLVSPAHTVLEVYGEAYPVLLQNKDTILKELQAEEERFLLTLQRGEKEFFKVKKALEDKQETIISGEDAFHLYDTYGFPREVTIEIAKEYGLTIDEKGFDVAFAIHQEKSKMDTNQTFKGGLQDHSDETTRLHTATHLLHQALRSVLGTHVSQKGSNITKDRLRFDFSHPEKMTAEQIQKVECIVNEQIQAALPVSMEVMTLEEAREKGALAFFNNKYDEQVKVYSIGDFSKEVCGGPHVDNIQALNHFSIQKEQSSSQGVRRIKAVLD